MSASPSAESEPRRRQHDAASLLDNLTLDDGQATEEQAKAATVENDKAPLFLTPLQHSLVYELTTRRRQIAKAQHRVDFWKAHDEAAAAKQAGQQSPAKGWQGRVGDQFGEDVVNEETLDDLIRQGKERLMQLHESQRLKEAIVESADAAHAINASMAAVAPAQFDQQAAIDTLSPLSFDREIAAHEQPLRSLVARRDQLALQFLRLDQDIKDKRSHRRKLAQEIQELRQTTSTLVQEIADEHRALAQQRQADTTQDSAVGEGGADTVGSQRRIARLKEDMQSVRGKREMIKGVIRGVVLESGLDWYGSRRLRKLMLSIGDDDLNSSDEEVDLFSDEDEGAEEAQETDRSSDEEEGTNRQARKQTTELSDDDDASTE